MTPGLRRSSGQGQEFDRNVKVWNPPARSTSVDAGAKRIPIKVHHAESSKPGPSASLPQQRTRHYSEEDHPAPVPESSQLSSSWQNSRDAYFPYDESRERDFGPGSYVTLPSKGSRRVHYEPFEQSDKRRTDFDFNNPYSTLPTIKPLKSSNVQQPFIETKPSEEYIRSSQSYDFGQNRRDLEHTLDYKDFSKPLYADTNFGNLRQSSVSSQEEGHSPHSDNAVSSSDSRDTIIAKDEKSSADSLPVEIPIEMRSREKPEVSPKPAKPVKMIPITVVHEQPSKPSSSNISQQDSKGKASLQ